MNRIFWMCILFVLCDFQISAQNYKIEEQSDELYNYRLTGVIAAHAVLYTGSIMVLDRMWYSQHPRSSFQWHDDALHWKQMDKLGHATTAYHLSKNSYKSFLWAGLPEGQAALWGSISGKLFLTTIEILDGFSEQWGASVSDLAANTLGASLFYSQQQLFSEQRVLLKFSYSGSGLAQHRPALLGSHWSEQIIKDYNGQTYWLSMNLNQAFGLQNFAPEWLNLAIGYGAFGMLGSETNPDIYNGVPLPHLQRYRKWYISPDINWEKLNTGNEFADKVLRSLNFVKFPAPALEYNSQEGFVFHWVFF